MERPDNNPSPLGYTIALLHPDQVLIGSDMREGHGTESRPLSAVPVHRIGARYGVHAAPRNHERLGGDSIALFAPAGIKYLEGRVEKLMKPFIWQDASPAARRGGCPSSSGLQSWGPQEVTVVELDVCIGCRIRIS